MLNQQLTGTYDVTESGSIAIAPSGNPVYAGFMVSPSKVVYVTSGNGSVPLVLVESQSDAPKHHRFPRSAPVHEPAGNGGFFIGQTSPNSDANPARNLPDKRIALGD
jgi:hypothetical protein